MREPGFGQKRKSPAAFRAKISPGGDFDVLKLTPGAENVDAKNNSPQILSNLRFGRNLFQMVHIHNRTRYVPIRLDYPNFLQ